MSTLILLRHGQSQWNLENRFTGWWDVDLSAQGATEAQRAGRLLAGAGIEIDVVHTSVLTRAIRTTFLALDALQRLWVPVHCHWRLNERHYGGLTGLDKDEIRRRYGEERFAAWRRSYDVAPPPLEPASSYDVASDPRYRRLPVEVIPATESLADVLARLLPYWYDAVVPDLDARGVVLVVAHGNSLRALVKHLDGISDSDIDRVELPFGVPLVYDLDERLHVVGQRRALTNGEGG